MTAKLSDNDVRVSPDHFQVFRAVVVLELGCLVLVSFVGSWAHVADQIHLKVWMVDCVERATGTNPQTSILVLSILVYGTDLRRRMCEIVTRSYTTGRGGGVRFRIHDQAKLEMRSRNRITSWFLLFYSGRRPSFAMGLIRLRPCTTSCRCYFTAKTWCGDTRIFAENIENAMRKVRQYSMRAERDCSNNSNAISLNVNYVNGVTIKVQLAHKLDTKVAFAFVTNYIENKFYFEYV